MFDLKLDKFHKNLTKNFTKISQKLHKNFTKILQN